MPQEKSVGAVIFRIENGVKLYLLLKYKEKHWDFVKGHIDQGETDMQTLFRETKEETSIEDLRVINGFKELHKYFFRQYKEKMSREDLKKNKTVWVFKLVNFYLAETKTEQIKISAEHQDYRWLPYEQALKMATFKNAKELLKKANNFLSKNRD